MKIVINNYKGATYTLSGAMDANNNYVNLSGISFQSEKDIKDYLAGNNLTQIPGMVAVKNRSTGGSTTYELDDSAYKDVIDFITSKGGIKDDKDDKTSKSDKGGKRRTLNEVKFQLLADIKAELVTVSKRNNIQINNKGLDGSGWRALADLGLYDLANKVQQAESGSQLQRDALAELVKYAQGLQVSTETDSVELITE